MSEYNEMQSLTLNGTKYDSFPDQKAREGIEDLENQATILYTTQELTAEQQAQARANIGALPDTYEPPDQTAAQVGADPKGTADKKVSDHNSDTDAHEDIRNKVHLLENYVTPQTFGAVGDGETDDTAAVQAALDNGGLIYFPPGRYKATSQLTATKAAKIMMFKPYPGRWNNDYPASADDNYMGARIECYGTDGIGMVFAEVVEIDGLFIRAMVGFSGTLLKYDGTLGESSYPSQVRISHVIADSQMVDRDTIPECLFEFNPGGNYFHLLDDIRVGNNSTYATYGFKVDVNQHPDGWAHSARITNMDIDVNGDYPFWMDGSGATNWIFDGLAIQVYPNDAHINVMTLKNMRETVFIGAFLWDSGNIGSNTLISTENVFRTACFGCSTPFDTINDWLYEQTELPRNLNITNLVMSVAGDATTGDNILSVSDGIRTKQVNIPSATVSEEQVEASISKWMDENSAPTEQVGKNKFNINSSDIRLNTYTYVATPTGGVPTEFNQASDEFWSTHAIAAQYGDAIRLSVNGTLCPTFRLNCYDAEMTPLGAIATSGGTDSYNQYGNAPVVTIEGTAFIKFAVWKDACLSEDVATSNVCITVNNQNISYEPYKVELVGGIGSFMVLQSPNGTQFKLAVNDDGTVTAEPVNG